VSEKEEIKKVKDEDMVILKKNEAANYRFKKQNKHADFIENIAYILDDVFTIPYTNIKFGYDAIIGLIPVIGDVLTSFLSFLIVLEALVQSAPIGIIFEMIKNIVIDTILGFVPIFGDFFDIKIRANRKNLNILKEFLKNK
jgi:hypothetical protein